MRRVGFSQTDLTQYAFLVACIGTMQFTTNYVFDRMAVGYALSLFQFSAIVSVFFGHWLFNEQVIRQKLIGSAIMITGSILIILLKDYYTETTRCKISFGQPFLKKRMNNT